MNTQQNKNTHKQYTENQVNKHNTTSTANNNANKTPNYKHKNLNLHRKKTIGNTKQTHQITHTQNTNK